MKMSYLVTQNMAKIINSKNAKVLAEKERNENVKECSCPKGKICPMGGKCLQKNVIYNATVSTENDEETYIGLCSTNFKSRLAIHKQSFKNENTNQTSLRKHILKLKSENMPYELSWRIIDRGNIFNPVSNVCQLCIREAYHIIFNKELASLNSKNEVFSSCRHKKGILLYNCVK